MSNEYESIRKDIIEKNNKFLRSLRLPLIGSNEGDGRPSKQMRMMKKKTNNSNEAPHKRPNLRSSKTLPENVIAVQNDVRKEHVIQETGHGSEHTCEEIAHGDIEQPRKRKSRGFTKKQTIWARGDKPLINLQSNELGQPIGSNATEFSNFIGTVVRSKGFPIAYTDWRLVPLNIKDKLFEDLQLFYEVTTNLREWVLTTAAKKWKDHKACLKEFLKKIPTSLSTDEQFLDIRDERINEQDWKWLVTHWNSEEAHARSSRGKLNRSKVLMPHTAGSKSFARVAHEMEEIGTKPRRDELYIKTHTHSAGIAIKGCEEKIKALKGVATEHPELREKTIQEGDLFSHVFGNEKKGHVRGLGLGSTPQSLEMSGV